MVRSSDTEHPAGAPIRPRLSVAQLLAAKRARPLRSVDELAAETFESDQELDAFLADLYASRRADTS